MATAIFFNGRRLNVPQAVTEIDASALAAVSPAAVGVVALVGTAVGGQPQTIDTSLADATRPETIQKRYRSGDLRTAGIFAFEPSADPSIPGGAARVIAVKVNTSLSSGVTLPDGNVVDSIDITSRDSGGFTEQINVEIDPGTVQGQKLTVVFEDITEVFDDVGGDSVMDVIYAPGADGYDTMSGSISATQFLAAATKASTGLVAERDADIPAPGVLDVTSSSAGDTTQNLTVYGLNGSDVPISEVFVLNGTAPIVGSIAFTKVLAAVLDAAAVGTVTVDDTVSPTTLFTLAPAILTRGTVLTTNTPAAGVATVSIDTDTAGDVVVRGTNAAGGAIAERFDMTNGDTTPVVGVVVFTSITAVDLGDFVGGRTVTIAINAVVTLHATFDTVAKTVDRLNALAGFTANANVTNFTTFAMIDMDHNVSPTRPAVSLLTPAKDFFADLFFIIQKYNQSSQLVQAARATGADLPPTNTSAAIYLVGGTEGATTITEWQSAFTLLQKRRYNIVVPLTRDPAIHNLLLTHLIAKAGRLKSECNGYVGIGKMDGTGETLSAFKSQIQALGTRHISAMSQEIERFDPITGAATFFPPYIKAAIQAGMQAGSAIAEPLTHKTMIGTGLRNDASWTVEDNIEELIDAGAYVSEEVDGIGIRVVRSLTTHLADDNLAFVEMSSNESLITAVFELRNAMEAAVGRRGLGNTVPGLQGIAENKLEDLVDEEKIVGFRALQIEQVGDVFPTSVELALVNPINFIPITIHVVPTVSAAA